MAMSSEVYNTSNRIFPFSGLLGDLAHGKIQILEQGSTIAEASRNVRAHDVDYFVIQNKGIPVGIVGKLELIKYGMVGDPPMDAPISSLMSRQIVSIQKDQPVLDGLMFMLKHDLKHMLVLDGDKPVGVVSEQDWLNLQEKYPSEYLRRVEQAVSVDEIAQLRKEANELIWSNFTSEGNAISLTNLITVINDCITRCLIGLALKRMVDEGKGNPPARFAWIGMGSEARKAQTLQTDQDNGLIFENVPPENYKTVQAWFLEFAGIVVTSLEVCGFPLCNGNIMATNPELCQSLEKWQATMKKIIFDADSKELFEASIYLDFRCLYGSAELADGLWRYMSSAIRDNYIFLRNLSYNLLRAGRPPVRKLSWRVYSMLGFKPAPFDIKKLASIPLDASIRILALANQVQETHTILRLQACLEKGELPKTLADEVKTAFDFILRLRFRLEFEAKNDAESGKNTMINPRELLPMQIRYLTSALNAIYELQDFVYQKVHQTRVPWYLK